MLLRLVVLVEVKGYRVPIASGARCVVRFASAVGHANAAARCDNVSGGMLHVAAKARGSARARALCGARDCAVDDATHGEDYRVAAPRVR